MRFTSYIIVFIISINNLLSQNIKFDDFLISRNILSKDNKEILFVNTKLLFDKKLDYRTHDTLYFYKIVDLAFFLPKEWSVINIIDFYDEFNAKHVKYEISFKIPNDSNFYLSSIISIPIFIDSSTKKCYFSENSKLKNLQQGLVYYNGEKTNKNNHLIKSYCKSAIKKYKLKQNSKPLYYSYSKSPYRVLGFDFYKLSFQNITVQTKNCDIILDSKTDGIYYHELAHYVLGEYNFNYFFHEGIATYLGGSGYKSSYKSDIKELLNYVNKNKNDSELYLKLISNKARFNNKLMNYNFANLILNNYVNSLGLLEFQKLINDESSILYDESLNNLIRFINNILGVENQNLFNERLITILENEFK